MNHAANLVLWPLLYLRRTPNPECFETRYGIYQLCLGLSRASGVKWQLTRRVVMERILIQTFEKEWYVCQRAVEAYRVWQKLTVIS